MTLFSSVLPQVEPGLAETFRGFLTPEGLRALMRAVLVVVTGFPLTILFSGWTRRLVAGRYAAQQGMVAEKVVFYLGLLIILVTVLTEMGFSLAPLLGAAGILGIALGFAAQTSVSNIISGFFLMAERPFVLDDLVQVGDITGRILTIDMLSVKLRTFDNRFVRIPNENLIKTEFINLTRFPIRRADVPVGVAYKEDVPKVREILLDVARENPRVLIEPEPQFFFQAYGSSSLDFLLGVWTRTENFFEVRNEVREEIKKRFDDAGIEIPFPHQTLYAGAVTEPFPIRLVGSTETVSETPADPEPSQSAGNTDTSEEAGADSDPSQNEMD